MTAAPSASMKYFADGREVNTVGSMVKKPCSPVVELKIRSPTDAHTETRGFPLTNLRSILSVCQNGFQRPNKFLKVPTTVVDGSKTSG